MPSPLSPAQPVVATAEPLPAELVRDVEELIRLTAEFNALAAQVKSPDDYRQRADAMASIERQLTATVEKVTVGEAQLDPGPRQEFNRRYFIPRAAPLIADKREHLKRIETLLQPQAPQQRQHAHPENCEAMAVEMGSTRGHCPP